MLVRQYAIKYFSLPEVKVLLQYFKCDFNKQITLGRFIKDLHYNQISMDEITNKNIQNLKSLRYTNPYLLNKSINKIKWF